MRIYLTRDLLKEGRIRIVEGHTQTGHSNTVQINGVSRYERIVEKPYWHTTLAEATEHASQMIRDRIASNLSCIDRATGENIRLEELLKKYEKSK